MVIRLGRFSMSLSLKKHKTKSFGGFGGGGDVVVKIGDGKGDLQLHSIMRL